MARLTVISFGFLICMVVWRSSVAQPPSQGNRLFDDICEDCIVSNGMGFVVDPLDCNCYFTCQLAISLKPSSGYSDWTSTKRCCPCGMSWSTKLLTCVDYKDKRSDCFLSGAMNTLCGSASADDEVARTSPNSADGSSMCTGYAICKLFGSTLVPQTNCCPFDECFDAGAGECNGDCTEAVCDPHGAEEDCLKPSTAPPSECQYTSVPNDDRQFMGRENMITFTCAPGTCWDDALCACVAANNTAYNDCDRPFLEMRFDSDTLEVEDGSGNTIWAEQNDVEFESEVAELDGSESYINVGGLANTFLSNTLVMRIELTLTEDDDDSVNTEQCIVGNCLDSDAGGGSDFLAVSVNRDGTAGTPGSADGSDIEISIAYQDETFMLNGGMETATLSIVDNFAVDTDYELWIIFSGDENFVFAGVFEAEEEILIEAEGVPITGSKQVLMGQSGFVFGKCETADDDLEADIDKVEFWRECKPYGNTDFETAFEALVADII